MRFFNPQRVVSIFLLFVYSSSILAVEVKASNELVANIVKFYNKKTLDIAKSLEDQKTNNPYRAGDLKSFLDKEKIKLKTSMPKLIEEGDAIILNLHSEKLTLKSVFPREMQINYKDQSVIIKNNLTSPQIKEKLSFLKSSVLASVVALELFEVSSKITSSIDLKKKVDGLQSWCGTKKYNSLTSEDRQVLMESIHLIYNLEGRCAIKGDHDSIHIEVCENLIPKATGCLAILLNGPSKTTK